MHIPTETPRVHYLTTPTHARRHAGHPLAGGRLGKQNAMRTILDRLVSSSRKNMSIQDADNATVHWAIEPIRRPKAGTGPRSARPKAGTACTGARECRPKAGTGLHWGRPKAGTGLHWGHVGVPCCRPKAGAGWAEGPALRRAQCARGAVSSALCTARGSAVCEPYIYILLYILL